MTIWKYALGVTDIQKLTMPLGATVLSVQTQNGLPVLWAMVNPELQKRDRVFITIGTGHPIDASCLYWKFIGTYQLEHGALIFHLFEDQGA